MKTNKRNKKVFLKKETIANLSNKEMLNVKGGHQGIGGVTHGNRGRLAMEMIVNFGEHDNGSHTH